MLNNGMNTAYFAGMKARAGQPYSPGTLRLGWVEWGVYGAAVLVRDGHPYALAEEVYRVGEGEGLAFDRSTWRPSIHGILTSAWPSRTDIDELSEAARLALFELRPSLKRYWLGADLTRWTPWRPR